MFDFSIVTNWFHNLLAVTCGLGDFWTILIECILVGCLHSRRLRHPRHHLDLHGA